MKNHPRIFSRIYILAILSMVFWGMSFVWTSIVFKYYHPITTIFIRLVISSMILWGYMLISGKRTAILKKDIPLMLLASLFNPFFYFLGENFGLKLSSPAISAVIIGTIPVFTPVAAFFTLKERLPFISIAGIFISFIGISIMLLNPDLTFNSSPLGALLLMGAVTAAVIYSIFIKRLASRYSALTIIAYQNTIGVIYFLPLFLAFDFSHFITVRPNTELILALLQLAFFASSLAYVFYTRVIAEIGVSRANVFSNLIPVVTAIFSAIFISEIFTLTKIAGMAVVIGGVALTQMRRGHGDRGTRGNGDMGKRGHRDMG